MNLTGLHNLWMGHTLLVPVTLKTLLRLIPPQNHVLVLKRGSIRVISVSLKPGLDLYFFYQPSITLEWIFTGSLLSDLIRGLPCWMRVSECACVCVHTHPGQRKVILQPV